MATLMALRMSSALWAWALRGILPSRTGIIADAKEEALQYKQELISKARSAAAEQLKQAESGMEEALDAAQKRAETVIEQFSRNLDEKKEKAVQMVIDYII